jgi:hypothetical protein
MDVFRVTHGVHNSGVVDSLMRRILSQAINEAIITHVHLFY